MPKQIKNFSRPYLWTEMSKRMDGVVLTDGVIVNIQCYHFGFGPLNIGTVCFYHDPVINKSFIEVNRHSDNLEGTKGDAISVACDGLSPTISKDVYDAAKSFINTFGITSNKKGQN